MSIGIEGGVASAACPWPVTPEDYDLLFERSQLIRPTPQEIGALAARGFTPRTLLNTAEVNGLVQPRMDLALQELRAVLPYAESIVDTLEARQNSRRRIYAGRDAEILYDIDALKYPSSNAVLLPASSHLWFSVGMRENDAAVAFLDGHHLDIASVMKDEAELVDTGFAGSIGDYIWKRLARIHGGNWQDVQQHLPVWLVHKKHNVFGAEQIDRFESETLAPVADLFPRAARTLQTCDYPLNSPERFTHHLAVAMQLMPRYHEGYSSLRVSEGEVVAVPGEPPSQESTTIDDVQFLNKSVVSVVAAAVTQLQTVKYVR